MLERPKISPSQQPKSLVDLAKWPGFQVAWSEDRKRSSALEEKFQVTWASR